MSATVTGFRACGRAGVARAMTRAGAICASLSRPALPRFAWRRGALPAAVALALVPGPLWAQDPGDAPTPAAIVAAAPPSDWRAIDPADLLVMTLTPDANGRERQTIIQLLPRPFSRGWIENVRILAREQWWDGTSVYRVADNWVAQWGAGHDAMRVENPPPAPANPLPKPLPAGLRVLAGDDIAAPIEPGPEDGRDYVLTPERHEVVINRWIDPYAITAFIAGWPVGLDEDGGRTAWPVHCYGSVGVAHSAIEPADTNIGASSGAAANSGAELYVVIGHAPRQLDRNSPIVGRVIEGIEHLASLPRGTGEAGAYADRSEHAPIVSVRLGSDLPESERPRFEYLASESDSFARYLHLRANRSDGLYRVPARGVDVCNAPVPIRRGKEAP